MSFIKELKRRNVFRVAIAYAVATWLLIEVSATTFPMLRLPEWTATFVAVLLMIGFPVALIFAWAFELTPEGLKKEKDVDRSESITHVTGRKLDFAIIGILAVALVFFASTHQWGSERESTDSTNTAKLGAQSIAVLPFANRSNRDEDLFFTDGIHDDLLTQLAKINDLKVISRTSVMHYRDTDMRVPQIAEELGVATVLEGGVQRAGQRIRINAQLIDVATDQHIWAETFDREMTIDNLFDIQTEITRQIVTAVRGQLTTEEQQALSGAPTHSLEAYDAFLRARNLLTSSGYNMEKYRAAQPYAEQAVALDPNFAMAHLLLADIHGMAVWMGYDVTPQRHQAARMALENAAAVLSPESPELLAAQSEYLYRFEQDYPASLIKLQRAHAAMPGNASILERLGTTQRRLGLWEDAIDSLLQSADLDPANANAMAIAANTLQLMQQWARLEEILLAARERFSDDTDLASFAAMLPLWSEGDVESARDRYTSVRPNTGEAYFFATVELPWYERDFAGVIESWDRPEILDYASSSGFGGLREIYLAQAYQQLDETDRADQLLGEAVQRLADIDRSRPGPLVTFELETLAEALALQGEKARAIEIAEEATRILTLESDSLEGMWPLKVLCKVLALTGERDRALEIMAQLIDKPVGFVRWELYLDPRWDFFRDDDRFDDLIRPHNLEQSIYAKESSPQ